MKVAFCTLGCKVNQAETRDLQKQFIAYGYTPIKFSAEADIFVFNTCSVTHIADRKSRNLIRRAVKLNPNAKIFVCGCYADLRPQELKKAIPEIYKLIKTKDKLNLNVWGIKKIMPQSPTLSLLPGEGSNRIRQFLKIEDGCDQYCAYCVIPYARGRVVSYPIDELFKQAKGLTSGGAAELVLTGINLGKYNDHGKDLVDLISELEKIPELKRIRLSSIEPNLITDKLIKKLKASEKLCPHLHIPLQSGSDKILKSMNRPYTLAQYTALLKKIRKEIPDINITTDIIVGFPGEDSKTFTETEKTLNRLKFSDMHIFKYSPREQTKSANWPEKLKPEQVQKMLERIQKLKIEVKINFSKKFVKKSLEVLIHEKKSDFYEGLTKNYLIVQIKTKKNIKIGQALTIKLESIDQEAVLKANF